MFKNKYQFVNYIFTLLILLCFNTCQISNYIVDCNKCYAAEPKFYTIKMLFTINDDNLEVYYTVYKGDYDFGEPVFYGITASTVDYFEVETNCYYTVVAEYNVGARCVNVVDGNKMHFVLNTTDCDGDCYLPQDYIFDLRLKY